MTSGSIYSGMMKKGLASCLLRSARTRPTASGSSSSLTRCLSNLSSSLNMNKASKTRRPLVYGQYEVTPMRPVPASITYPDYGITGNPRKAPSNIFLYNDLQIQKLRRSARLARKILDFANSLAKPGITTEEIDILTHEEIIKHGAYPSPINFYGFPKAICTSVNEVVCHGIPDTRPLEDGDMLSIDVSLFLDGYHGDNCGTVIVGEGDATSKRLLSTTQLALDKAISLCRPGA
jgi:methionyl aminopeptidase